MYSYSLKSPVQDVQDLLKNSAEIDKSLAPEKFDQGIDFTHEASNGKNKQPVPNKFLDIKIKTGNNKNKYNGSNLNNLDLFLLKITKEKIKTGK